MTVDEETAALARIYSELIVFDHKTRRRMLNWLVARSDADYRAPENAGAAGFPEDVEERKRA